MPLPDIHLIAASSHSSLSSVSVVGVSGPALDIALLVPISMRKEVDVMRKAYC